MSSRNSSRRWSVALVASFAAALTACGSDAPEGSGASAGSGASDLPTVVVTTNILGDVVSNVLGDSANVVTLMPVGADPHDFQASAQEIDALMNADAVIVNGNGFEEGLLDVIENAEEAGVPTHEAMSAVDTIDFDDEHGHDDHADDEHGDDEHGHDDHADDEHGDDEHGDEEHAGEEHAGEEHADEEHGDEEHGDEHADDDHKDEEHAEDEHGDDEHDHAHSGADPHFFTDPARMADAVDAMVDFLASTIEFGDVDAVRAAADAYIAQLTELDSEIAELVEQIPAEQRVLVTNHEVFGYFADRYGFEVVGAVVPGGGTTDNVSAAAINDLAEVIVAEGVPAIFADASSSDRLVQTLADEVGDIAVVELFSESLGEAGSGGETYLEMVRTNAERISAALS